MHDGRTIYNINSIHHCWTYHQPAVVLRPCQYITDEDSYHVLVDQSLLELSTPGNLRPCRRRQRDLQQCDVNSLRCWIAILIWPFFIVNHRPIANGIQATRGLWWSSSLCKAALPFYIHPLSIWHTLCQQQMIMCLPNPPWKKELQNKEHKMINGEKNKGIWDVRVFHLFEDNLVTESIALWNASVDCLPLHFPDDDGLVQMTGSEDRQGVGCSLDNLFLDYPLSLQFKNNRVLLHQHCYMTEEWWGFHTKKGPDTLHLYEVFIFSQPLHIMLYDRPVFDMMTMCEVVRQRHSQRWSPLNHKMSFKWQQKKVVPAATLDLIFTVHPSQLGRAMMMKPGVTD